LHICSLQGKESLDWIWDQLVKITVTKQRKNISVINR
jgi:hypothetical protein